MIRNNILAAAASLAALALAAPPLAAQDDGTSEQTDNEKDKSEDFIFLTEEEEAQAQLEQEMAQTFAVMGEMFKAEPLTPEQEALLPLATEMAGLIMPQGSFSEAVQVAVKPMMATLSGEVNSDPRTRLAEISGVETEDLEALSDENAQEALDIFDPHHAVRTERSLAMVVSLIGKLTTEIEPAYRTALAQSLATRFNEQEMRDLLTFFATPLGAKFAQQSFAVQMDPRMMGAMEAMGPAMVKLMPDVETDLAAIEAEFGAARDFTDLSSSERRRAARLIGKSVSELDALVPEITTEDEGEDEEEDPIT
jgi:hypothetical protein